MIILVIELNTNYTLLNKILLQNNYIYIYITTKNYLDSS
jgi:hypothetical protein